jgi:hypothetical protein
MAAEKHIHHLEEPFKTVVLDMIVAGARTLDVNEYLESVGQQTLCYSTVSDYRKRKDIVERITARNKAVDKSGLALKENRIALYKERILLKLDLSEARSVSLKKVVAGGSTGLIVEQVKPLKGGRKLVQYVYDSALEKDIMADLKQLAIEVGDWNEKSEFDFKGLSDTDLLLRASGITSKKPSDNDDNADRG